MKINQPKASSMNNTLERPLLKSVLNGWRLCCPSCGNGKLMKSYLTVAQDCGSCSQEFHFQRVDDGPAYITILVLGHLLVPLILVCYEMFRPEPVVMALGLSGIAIILALLLLPRIKGALIGLQWAKRMHGF
tara:strand:- start:291 stop:686 length:396 start_codon:yes stop_codon:yes gene_type:complete